MYVQDMVGIFMYSIIIQGLVLDNFRGIQLLGILFGCLGIIWGGLLLRLILLMLGQEEVLR